MRRSVIAAMLVASCTMPNPLFDDGSFADEAAGTDERPEGDDEVADESGSGSGDSSSSSESGPDSTESTDEQSSIDSSSSDAESSSDSTDSIDTTDMVDTTDVVDTTGVDTGVSMCMGLIADDPCEECAYLACCNDATLECFDPQKADGCMCVFDCLNLGTLINLCGIQCGVFDLLLSTADSAFECLEANCGSACL